MDLVKVAILGSGNWGSAIARIIGGNATEYPDVFDPAVNLWVFEELVDGKKLTDIINTEHENVKYLPGFKLPNNVVAKPDLLEACRDADILVFVLPHQFIHSVCEKLKGRIKKSAIGISLIKGLMVMKGGRFRLVSEEISYLLSIEVAVLMGANLAHEVAMGNFCEATIGCRKNSGANDILQTLFHTPNFQVRVVEDALTVELCGALKNIVACAAGFTDGLGYGDNTKAAVIRLGILELIDFTKKFYGESNLETFFESCGIADIVTTCYGGRNRKVCEAFVKSGKPLKEVEDEVLHGQSAQGPICAAEVCEMIKDKQLQSSFPLFVAVNDICQRRMEPSELIAKLQNHPVKLR